MSEVSERWNSYICDSRGCYLVNDPEITFQDHEEAEAYCDEHNRALVGQAAEERAKIVAWLKDIDPYALACGVRHACANAIEAKEHLK
jgi:hypothetical protein